MWASEPMPFVVFVSGAGSNCAVLLEHARNNPTLLKAQAVISDRSGAPALDIAASLDIETFVVSNRDEGPLLALLRKLQPRWACLAGYKRIVGSGFLDFFSDEGFSRVLNVHPSLLPAYPGLNAYERAFKDGVKISGVTVHLVDAGLDTGTPVLQESFERQENDRLDDFIARGKEIEHRLYPMALDLAAAGKIRLVEMEKGARWISAERGARS